MLVCAEYIPHSSPVGGGNTPKCWLPTANQIKEEEVKSALKALTKTADQSGKKLLQSRNKES